MFRRIQSRQWQSCSQPGCESIKPAPAQSFVPQVRRKAKRSHIQDWNVLSSLTGFTVQSRQWQRQHLRHCELDIVGLFSCFFMPFPPGANGSAAEVSMQALCQNFPYTRRTFDTVCRRRDVMQNRHISRRAWKSLWLESFRRTVNVPVRSETFHSGMPKSSAKISPISQYAWELMNMLEDTQPQSQVWSERPIAAADSLFWIFWWQGFCKEASLMKGKYEHTILHTCACCCTKNMICLLFGRGASVWYNAGQIWRLTKMILLGWKLTGLQFGK